MISMDTGIEAVLSVGAQASQACPGGARPMGPAASGPNGMPERAAANESASFRQALRTAADTQKSVSTRGRQSTPETALGQETAASPKAAVSAENDVLSLWFFLSQALQAMTAGATAQAPSDEAQEVPAAGSSGEEELPDELSKFIDLMQRLSQSEGGPGTANMEGNGEAPALLASLEEFAGTEQAQGFPGGLRHFWRDRGEQTPDTILDRMSVSTEADDPEALAGEMGKLSNSAAPRAQTKGSEAAASMGQTAPVILERAGRVAAPAGEPAALAADLVGPESSCEDRAEAGRAPAPEHAIGAGRPALKMNLLAGSSAPVGLEKTQAETACGPDALPHAEESSPDLCGDHSADGGDSRHSEDSLPLWQASAAAETLAEEGPASERFAVATRESHAFDPSAARSGKTTEAAAAAGERETAVRPGVFDQIVQRAAVLVKNQSSEIQIDLKPDFLGQVRMQIVTEAQQVTVRILTELPAVRDMIETHLHQLKSELQSQGLQVERLEVAVADDGRRNPWRRTGGGGFRKAGGTEGVAAAERTLLSEHLGPAYHRPRSGRAAGIDMFV